jgi:hypothetical protein
MSGRSLAPEVVSKTVGHVKEPWRAS